MRLSEKVAHVTGAARGIGAAIARAFAREGAYVVVSDLNLAGAESVVREIGDAAFALGSTYGTKTNGAQRRRNCLIASAGSTSW